MGWTEEWYQGSGENKELISVPVEDTGSDVEPTGTVTVSIELFREILKQLGYSRDE